MDFSLFVPDGTNATPPAREDGVFSCSEQLQLTVDSGAPSGMARSSTVHCQLELQGIVENRSSLAGGVAFDILWCWKDDPLQTSEYSLQGKYNGEVTNTTKNEALHHTLFHFIAVQIGDSRGAATGYVHNPDTSRACAYQLPAGWLYYRWTCSK